MGRSLRLGSFAEVERELDALENSGAKAEVYPVLAHCALSIELSMRGYPEHKPRWFKATIGRLALRKFLMQGYMSHDWKAPIPGAPPVAREGTHADGIAHLRRAMESFRSFSGE